MSSSKRTLRSSKPPPQISNTTSTSSTSNTLPPPPTSLITITSSPSTPSEPIKLYTPGTKLPLLNTSSLNLLRLKQRTLKASLKESFPSPTHLHALNATLIFAQHEAGTAVIVHPDGWILTCAHCFGDSKEDYQKGSKRRWMLMYDGIAVLVECRVWDGRRDLALLKIIALELNPPLPDSSIPQFPSLQILKGNIKRGTSIFCIGQPGSEDLESKVTGKKVQYKLFEISEGEYFGIAEGQDPQVNEEIGALMHGCWTYWGHSGAPLVLEKGDGGKWGGEGQVGKLVGLHSSWDEETGMRRGVHGAAVREFLRESRGVVDVFGVGNGSGNGSGHGSGNESGNGNGKDGGRGSRDDPVML